MCLELFATVLVWSQPYVVPATICEDKMLVDVIELTGHASAVEIVPQELPTNYQVLEVDIMTSNEMTMDFEVDRVLELQTEEVRYDRQYY